MFFLLRTAFWIGLVILLLPIGTGEEGDEASGVSAFEALAAAQSTVSDLSGFCSRNPSTCETGGQALQTFGAKARESARLVYEYLDDTVAKPEEIVSLDDAQSLATADREPQWIAPRGNEDAITVTGSISAPVAQAASSATIQFAPGIAIPSPKPALSQRKV